MNHSAPLTTIVSDLHQPQRGPNTHSPSKAMLWYDSIIDDMFANPGTTLKATASRLGRSPVTIGYVVNSDMFRARYAQRRNQFNEDLDTKMVHKLSRVADLALDLTFDKMTSQRTAIPLPLLHEVADKALSRLGYGPKQGPAVSVQVNQNNSVAIPTSVSPQALAEARASLRTIESSRQALAPAGRTSSFAEEPSSRSEPGSTTLEAGEAESPAESSVAPSVAEGYSANGEEGV